MKKIKISEKARIAYLCVLFLALAFSLTVWRTSQSAKRLMDTDKTSAVTTQANVTEKPTAKTVEIPVTDVPDTRNETTEPATEAVKPLDSFISPVNGKVLMHYSNGELVNNEQTNDWRTHNGTDFAAESGTEVYSINNGIVLAVYDDALWGTVVEIDHGNRVQAKYCGLTDVKVKSGDRIKSGSVIAKVGKIPIESKAPHIHLEVRSGSALINPIDIIN